MNANNKLISVIIPTYNRESCIRNAVKSVLNQTYNNLEIIVVDDCSTDNTIEIVNGINDKRIRYLVNDKNRGACYSRNKGVDAANGSIIAFEDSDDVWLPDKLRKNIEALEQHNADVVFSYYILNDKIVRPNVNLNESSDKLKTMFLNTCIGTPTLVMKKSIFEKERFDDNLPRFQDYDLSLRLVSKYNIYFIPEVLVKAYASIDGITKKSASAVYALNEIYKKHSHTIDNTPDIAYEFNIKLGKYCEESGKKGTEYFKKAMQAKKTGKIFLEYLLSVVRLYRPIYNLYDLMRGKY